MSDFELNLESLTSDISELENPDLLAFYGPFGSGKTWLAASAAEVASLSPVLYLDFEGSTSGTIHQFKDLDIDVINVPKVAKGKEWSLIKKLLGSPTQGIQGELFTKKHKYKTVVIDPLNTVGLWAEEAGHDPGDHRKKWTFLQDTITHTGKGILAQLKSADFLSIVVIHEQIVADDGDVAQATFRWRGGGQSQLGQLPDAILYLTRDTNNKGESTTTAWTRPTKRNQAKNKFDLPFKIEDPSMSKIYELIENREKESK